MKGGISMETLVKALGPAIVAAFAVQQLLELLDPGVVRLFRLEGNDEKDKKKKRLVLGIVSLIVGLVLAFGVDEMRVLQHFGVAHADFLDAIVTAVIISGGTEGSNSVLKILEYLKGSLKEDRDSGGD
jgi:hypothetical protein